MLTRLREFVGDALQAPLDIPSMGWGLQWHPYRDLAPAARWMSRLIQDTPKSLGT